MSLSLGWESALLLALSSLLLLAFASQLLLARLSSLRVPLLKKHYHYVGLLTCALVLIRAPDPLGYESGGEGDSHHVYSAAVLVLLRRIHLYAFQYALCLWVYFTHAARYQHMRQPVPHGLRRLLVGVFVAHVLALLLLDVLGLVLPDSQRPTLGMVSHAIVLLCVGFFLTVQVVCYARLHHSIHSYLNERKRKLALAPAASTPRASPRAIGTGGATEVSKGPHSLADAALAVLHHSPSASARRPCFEAEQGAVWQGGATAVEAATAGAPTAGTVGVIGVTGGDVELSALSSRLTPPVPLVLNLPLVPASLTEPDSAQSSPTLLAVGYGLGLSPASQEESPGARDGGGGKPCSVTLCASASDGSSSARSQGQLQTQTQSTRTSMEGWTPIFMSPGNTDGASVASHRSVAVTLHGQKSDCTHPAQQSAPAAPATSGVSAGELQQQRAHLARWSSEASVMWPEVAEEAAEAADPLPLLLPARSPPLPLPVAPTASASVPAVKGADSLSPVGVRSVSRIRIVRRLTSSSPTMASTPVAANSTTPNLELSTLSTVSVRRSASVPDQASGRSRDSTAAQTHAAQLLASHDADPTVESASQRVVPALVPGSVSARTAVRTKSIHVTAGSRSSGPGSRKPATVLSRSGGSTPLALDASPPTLARLVVANGVERGKRHAGDGSQGLTSAMRQVHPLTETGTKGSSNVTGASSVPQGLVSGTKANISVPQGGPSLPTPRQNSIPTTVRHSSSVRQKLRHMLGLPLPLMHTDARAAETRSLEVRMHKIAVFFVLSCIAQLALLVGLMLFMLLPSGSATASARWTLLLDLLCLGGGMLLLWYSRLPLKRIAARRVRDAQELAFTVSVAVPAAGHTQRRAVLAPANLVPGAGGTGTTVVRSKQMALWDDELVRGDSVLGAPARGEDHTPMGSRNGSFMHMALSGGMGSRHSHPPVSTPSRLRPGGSGAAHLDVPLTPQRAFMHTGGHTPRSPASRQHVVILHPMAPNFSDPSEFASPSSGVRHMRGNSLLSSHRLQGSIEEAGRGAWSIPRDRGAAGSDPAGHERVASDSIALSRLASISTASAASTTTTAYGGVGSQTTSARTSCDHVSMPDQLHARSQSDSVSVGMDLQPVRLYRAHSNAMLPRVTFEDECVTQSASCAVGTGSMATESVCATMLMHKRHMRMLMAQRPISIIVPGAAGASSDAQLDTASPPLVLHRAGGLRTNRRRTDSHGAAERAAIPVVDTDGAATVPVSVPIPLPSTSTSTLPAPPPDALPSPSSVAMGSTGAATLMSTAAPRIAAQPLPELDPMASHDALSTRVSPALPTHSLQALSEVHSSPPLPIHYPPFDKRPGGHVQGLPHDRHTVRSTHAAAIRILS